MISSLSSWIPQQERGEEGRESSFPPTEDKKMYYDSRGKIRQKLARAILEGELERENFEELKTTYDKWRNEIEYLVLSESSKKDLRDIFLVRRRIFGVKCSKRGNDIYIKKRILKRLRPLLEVESLLKEGEIHALFLTLTCDPSKYNGRGDAWRDFGVRWNRLISWIRRKRQDNYYDYSKRYIGFFRVFESTKKGYPHIHAILFFKNNVFIPNTKINEIWGAYTWVEKVRNVKGAIKYLIKYLEKSFIEKDHLLTPSILWMFGLRSFGVSSSLFYLIQHLLHNSNRKQKTLTFENADITRIHYHGIYTGDELIKEAREINSLVQYRVGRWYISLDFYPTERRRN